MHARKLVLVASLLLLLGMARAIAAETGRRYVETHGTRVRTVVYAVVRSADGFTVSSVSEVSTETGVWVNGVGLVAWDQQDPSIGNRLSGRRNGNVVTFTGTLAGKPVRREVTIGAEPWYQVFGPGLAELLPAGMNAREFWVIDPSDLAPHKMLVRRAGADTITVGGSRLDVQKIHFSPAGALAPFWGADFWYRRSDGAWVFSRLPEDGGVTVSELEEPLR